MADQTGDRPSKIPTQQQELPGSEEEMKPAPQYLAPNYKGSGKLKGKVAIITGGDSGIGRSVAILYAREGAKGITLFYHSEDDDAKKTQQFVEAEGAQVLLIRGDVAEAKQCNYVVEETVKKFGQLDILVNNAAVQFVRNFITEIKDEEFERTFKVNIFGYFYMARAAVPHLKKGSSIINTGSVVSYKGHEKLLDYSTTKGAIKTFTYSLSAQLAEKGIRVNGVAPGPILTPLIPATMDPEDVKDFGSDVPLERCGQPEEVSPCYVFLASEADSSYITGQFLHPNGGTITHG
eukprot:TRINITY_DN27318_c0_g1_i1.p1 TRINITY_DN27318_c0_g1~~TRINITY_DN27318_c0_g1_i1.p1  ORF type:complete len:292 (-),score=84.21 TRINITY_DN27318_c0_g1_i1:23-898(-)